MSKTINDTVIREMVNQANKIELKNVFSDCFEDYLTNLRFNLVFFKKFLIIKFFSVFSIYLLVKRALQALAF